MSAADTVTRSLAVYTRTSVEVSAMGRPHTDRASDRMLGPSDIMELHARAPFMCHRQHDGHNVGQHKRECVATCRASGSTCYLRWSQSCMPARDAHTLAGYSKDTPGASQVRYTRAGSSRYPGVSRTAPLFIQCTFARGCECVGFAVERRKLRILSALPSVSPVKMTVPPCRMYDSSPANLRT